MQYDLSLAELHSYRPQITEPTDFDDFWKHTIAESRAMPSKVTCTPLPIGLTGVDTYDVAFPGFGSDPIRAWLRLPVGRDERARLPLVVQFPGYGGGRGWPTDPAMWPLAGYAHLSVDVRGQGLDRQRGDTPDPHSSESGEAPGWVTRGIRDRSTAYYRRVFTDAVRAVDAAAHLPGVDPRRVALDGTSQGGGIALAAAGLGADVKAVISATPFLSHIELAMTRLTDAGPSAEIARFLKSQRADAERVLRTLSYLDVATHATRAEAPLLMSAALMDTVCPPRTVFAAFNRYGAADKEIAVYPYNGHEGGEGEWDRRKLDWLRSRLPAAPIG